MVAKYGVRSAVDSWSGYALGEPNRGVASYILMQPEPSTPILSRLGSSPAAFLLSEDRDAVATPKEPCPLIPCAWSVGRSRTNTKDPTMLFTSKGLRFG
jgi:hypothetical protein